MKIAFYGGSFDPPHKGHLAVADALMRQFALDEFVFIPAFHAPHKHRLKPTPAYDRYTMLCLATNDRSEINVSRIEIEQPDRPYTVETISRLKMQLPDDRVLFVMGADSWMEITTWRDWETLLLTTDIIVMTRPGYATTRDHVTDEIRAKVIEVAGMGPTDLTDDETHIYIMDTVNIEVSATGVREKIRSDDPTWESDVPNEVAKYVEKYQIYT